MKFYFSNYGWLQYIDSRAYCRHPNMEYVETYFQEHAKAGLVSELPFKLFGVNSIDVVVNLCEEKFYFTFLQ